MEKQELLELIAQLNPVSAPYTLAKNFERIVSPEDISYCFSRLPKGPSYYARLRFAGHDVWAKDAAYHLSNEVLNKLPTYKTPKAFIGKDMIRKICQAAIWEHMGNTLCPTCNGRGDFHPPGSAVITCPTCEGFRVVSASTNRHKAFNMDLDEWKRWENIYLQALKILDKWQGKIFSVIASEFGRRFLYINYLVEGIKTK